MSSVILPGRVCVVGLCAALAGVIAPPPPAASEPTVRRVLIEEFAFVPERLEIRAGDEVEWVNRDIAPHTATASDRAWDTGGLTKGRSAEVGFPGPGTFAYFCSYHPHMRGEIVVVGEQAGDFLTLPGLSLPEETVGTGPVQRADVEGPGDPLPQLR